MPRFIKGLQLCHDFYFECVAPLMEEHFSEIYNIFSKKLN